MGNAKSSARMSTSSRGEFSPEAEKIMMEVLSGQTADGDRFPTNRELKSSQREKERDEKDPKKRRSNELRRSRLIQAYSNTREVNESVNGQKRRATVKGAWAEALASRRTKEVKNEMKRSNSAPMGRLRGNKAPPRAPKPRRDTLGPAHMVTVAGRASKS